MCMSERSQGLEDLIMVWSYVKVYFTRVVKQMGVCVCVCETLNLTVLIDFYSQAPLLACEAPFRGSDLCCRL